MEETEQRALEAREAKRSAKFKTALVVLMVAILMDIAVVVTVLRGQAPPTAMTVIILAFVTVGLAALAAVLAYAPHVEARRLAESPGRRDREQRVRTVQMLIMSVSSAVFALVAVLRGRDIMVGETDLSAVMVVAAFIIMAVTLPAMVMGWDGEARAARRFLEDELTQVFRARAVATGFWVLLPGVVLVYLFGLWRPEQAVVLMPLVLWAGAAAACLRFALLHLAADRDE